MPIALPCPRAVFERFGFSHLTHITSQVALFGAPGGRGGIVQRAVLREGSEWAWAEVDLIGTSGFGGGGRRLLRDYSVVDLELGVKGRGSYTYFFAGDPSGWGLLKNIGVRDEAGLLDRGLAIIRVPMARFLDTYKGPLFYRPDDRAVVIRGGYRGMAEVRPIMVNG